MYSYCKQYNYNECLRNSSFSIFKQLTAAVHKNDVRRHAKERKCRLIQLTTRDVHGNKLVNSKHKTFYCTHVEIPATLLSQQCSAVLHIDTNITNIINFLMSFSFTETNKKEFLDKVTC